MIHAYVICEPRTVASLPPRRGLGGARLRMVVADGLAAVYSRHRSVQPSPELVMAHERVVEAVMANGTVLPLRFGTRLDGEDELVAALAARHEELAKALDRVRGRVEIALRIIPRTPEGAASVTPAEPGDDEPTLSGDRTSGRTYLQARVREHRLVERCRREIHHPLTDLAKANVLASRVSPPAIVAASYLVSADQAEDFRTRAAELAATVEEVQSFVTGPWPPYNFVDLRELPTDNGSRSR